MSLWKFAAPAAIILAASSCTGDVTTPVQPQDGPSMAIVDAAHSSAVPGFFFLPPMVKGSVSPTGIFDAGLRPRVEVCELSGAACGQTVASFSFGTGSSSVRVDAAAQQYIANWNTPRSLNPDRFYRVQVFVGTFRLGYADVDVVRNGREKNAVDESRFVALIQGQTLPVKFRLETGIAAGVTVAPASASVASGGTQQFTATVTDLHGAPLAAPVAWSTSDAAVATVSATGLATGGSVGTATITATVQAASGTALLTVFNPNTPPVASADTFQAIGNVSIPVAAPGVLANDSDGEGNPLAAVAGVYPTSGGGSVALEADGSFRYRSAPGFIGEDRFDYTVTDGQATATATAAVVSAYRVWYVDNTAAAPGDGRDASPFATLKAAEAASSVGETVFVRAGSGSAGYDEGFVLKPGQSLTGQGIAGAVMAQVNGQAVTLLAPGGTPDLARSGAGTGLQLASNNTVQGVRVRTAAGTGIAGVGFGTLTADAVSVEANGGAALDLVDGTAAAAFGTVSSAGSAGSGVRLANVRGSLSATDGTLTGAADPAVAVAGGDADVTYAGDVASSVRTVQVEGRTGGALTLSGSLSDTGDGILVRNNSGGTVAFTGSSKTLDTGASSGVTLDNNGGAAVQFAGGGLAIQTTTADGFRATGGGTVTVTGAGNTIATSAGTALRVTGVTTGPAGLTFRSISAAAGVNGMVLRNTGGVNTLQVTGSGAAASGGTIQGMSGDGVLLEDVSGVSLTSVVLRANQGSGVAGQDVSGFSLEGAQVLDNGDSAAADEAGLRFANLLGASSIRDSEIAGSVEDNLRVVNTAGALSLSVSGTTVRDNVTASGQDGVRLVSAGAAQMGVLISGSHLLRNRATGISASTQAGGTLHVDVEGGSLRSNSVGISLVHGSTGTFTFDVDGIPVITGHASSPVNVNRLATAGAASVFAGAIRGNVIGTAGVANSGATSGSGIRVVSNGASGSTSVSISGNRIREVTEFGVQAAARDGGSTLRATITGNDIALTSPLAIDGIRVEAGALSTDSVVVCAAVSGNTTSAPVRGIRLRQRFAGTTFRLAGYSGAPTDNAAVAAFLAGSNTVSSASADNGGPGFTGVVSCPAP